MLRINKYPFILQGQIVHAEEGETRERIFPPRSFEVLPEDHRSDITADGG